jgi:hypothetical protein
MPGWVTFQPATLGQFSTGSDTEKLAAIVGAPSVLEPEYLCAEAFPCVDIFHAEPNIAEAGN